jgi:hypothetical protein
MNQNENEIKHNVTNAHTYIAVSSPPTCTHVPYNSISWL